MGIFDANGNELNHAAFVLNESSESAAFVVRIEPRANDWLKADNISGVAVLARRTGSSDAFQNLGVAPINLSAFVNSSVDFDVKLAASAVSVPVARFLIPLRVTPNP